MKKSYDHSKIEKKWQREWKDTNLFVAPDSDSDKENYYALVEFPYPSGDLHVGHWYAFAVTDIYVRYMRAQGKNVMFPIGFDAFGLPAENAAIKHGKDPEAWTIKNMEDMKTQLGSMGASFDWSRVVASCDPRYYKWTQWIMTQFFENNLMYQKEAPVNWCDSCKTVLANEQVVNGHCDRCGTEVIQKQMKQWMLKITDYADRLIDDLEKLNWPEEIKTAQKNWIGRSEGTEVDFAVSNTEEIIKVFTTRVDTIFGATYMVLAPEHPLIQKMSDHITNIDEVNRYVLEAQKKSELERSMTNKEKSGVELKGITAINPATKEEIPVWIADYVLANYGTGAIMAVPAHDERDFAFAKTFDLPIKKVVIPRCVDHNNPHVEGKEIVFRNGIIAVIKDPKTEKFLCLKWKKQPWTTFVIGGIEGDEDPVIAAKREILEETGFKNLKLVHALCGPLQAEFFAAHKDVNRILHSWSLYFELEDEEQEEITAEELAKHEVVWLDRSEITDKNINHSEMPYILEALESGNEQNFNGRGVLINSGDFDGLTSEEAKEKISDFVNGKQVKKYKLRDWSVSRQRYWGCPIPIVYDPEGKPHAVPKEHLPWTLPTDVDFTPTGVAPLAKSEELKKRVIDIFGEGWTPEVETLDTFVDSSWYFLRFADPQNAEAFASGEKMDAWMPVDFYSGGAEHTTMHLLYSRFFTKALYDLGLVKDVEPYTERLNRGIILGTDGNKMSKSKGNVLNPDEFVTRLGADTVRMYLAFIGPYNEVGSYPWNIDSVAGVHRFLERVWTLGTSSFVDTVSSDIEKELHKTIKAVGESLATRKLNTGIANLMGLLNVVEKTGVTKDVMSIFLQLLAPYAPHIAEELWNELGNEGSVSMALWPKFDEERMQDTEMTIVVQVNGKVRGDFAVAVGSDEEGIKSEAQKLPNIIKWIEGKNITKVIYVPGKLVSIVAHE